MTTLLPKDADNNAIPALRLKSGGAHELSVTSASTRNSQPFDGSTKVVSVYATAPVYLNFGGSSVSATSSDHYFPAGVYYDIAVSGGGGKGSKNTHVAAISVDEDATLYVSEKE